MNEVLLLRVVSVGLAVAVVLVFGAYLHLRISVHDRVARDIHAWRERELDGVREQLRRAALDEARAALTGWQAQSEAQIRADAIRRSTSVVTGKVSEQLAPYLPGFTYNPKDARFLGSPVDLVVFDGLGEGTLREVVFVEVKSGGATLSSRERSVRDAIRSGRVRWEEFHAGN